MGRATLLKGTVVGRVEPATFAVAFRLFSSGTLELPSLSVSVFCFDKLEEYNQFLKLN